MLYERWRDIVREHRDDLALRDLTAGRSFTFHELDQAVAGLEEGAGPVLFPQGHGVGFVLAVLQGWRHGRALCPLDAGQSPPKLAVVPPGCVHLKLTSASTGPARLIGFTAAQLAADAENIVATMGLCREWPNLGVISLAHSYGFSNLVLPLLLHGIPLLLAGPPLPEIIRQAAAHAPALTLPAVPALWRAWHEGKAIPPSVRLAISAGAPLPVALEQAVFAASGLKIHNFYGATECGGIAYDTGETPRQDESCVGRPLANVRLALAADGCLEVQSAAVAQTAWPAADPRLGNGRFQTSDLAELSGGQVFLRGRLGDQINVAGRKVSPEAVERALLAHPAVRECLVFGAPSADAERTELIVACVATKPATPAGQLRAFLLERLPAWQVPREWILVDALPVNERGKLSRAEWRHRFLAERSARGARD